jgi:hypothetical protein
MGEMSEASKGRRPAAPAGEGRRPCVGLPVQYHAAEGGGVAALPAVLQRRGLVNPDAWDVLAWPTGAVLPVCYPGVERSDAPAPGRWTFLPE